MTPAIDLAAAVARLEKENRNLITRVERLEKQRGSVLLALLANAILLVTAGLLADYLGLFPTPIERLPLQAKQVQANEFAFRTAEGHIRARIVFDDKGFRVVDLGGQQVFPKPSAER